MNVRPYPMTDVQTKLWQPMFAFEPHVKEILAKAFEAPCTKATRKLGRAFFDFLQFKAAVSQIGTVKERESKHKLARVPYKASLVFFPWQVHFDNGLNIVFRVWSCLEETCLIR